VVPVFVNTFWEPNPPSAARCYDFGVALGTAIESFPEDLRVGVVASGGLSHFVVDEELAGELVDYQPCYRSEAGTGNAMGFVTWA
jgi:3-O-methylgallate 3,4-dioxygenase